MEVKENPEMATFAIYDNVPKIAINREAITALEGAVIKNIQIENDKEPYFRCCNNQIDGAACEESLQLNINILLADGHEVVVPGVMTACLTSPRGVTAQHDFSLLLEGLWLNKQYSKNKDTE